MDKIKKNKKIKVVLVISAILCWIASLVPLIYVISQAIGSMSGTIHGFHGPMLYGLSAFFDTIFMYIAFFFPLFLLWVVVVVLAITTTIVSIILHILYISQ